MPSAAAGMDPGVPPCRRLPIFRLLPSRASPPVPCSASCHQPPRAAAGADPLPPCRGLPNCTVLPSLLISLALVAFSASHPSVPQLWLSPKGGPPDLHLLGHAVEMGCVTAGSNSSSSLERALWCSSDVQGNSIPGPLQFGLHGCLPRAPPSLARATNGRGATHMTLQFGCSRCSPPTVYLSPLLLSCSSLMQYKSLTGAGRLDRWCSPSARKFVFAGKRNSVA